MNTKFVLRKNKNKGSIYLHATGNGQRERINLDIKVNPIDWNKLNQRLFETSDFNKDINLIIDNVQSKITNIKTVYRLSEVVLTPERLKDELNKGLTRTNFCSFFEMSLNDERLLIKKGSFRRHESVLNKLKDYQDPIFFHEINLKFIEKYRIHLAKIGNKKTTIASNLISIKKYLKLAMKAGIKFPIEDLDDIKTGSTRGNRVSLNLNELKTLYDYFKSDFINQDYTLVLGYFLFGCMTGLRFSDVMELDRPKQNNNDIDFSTIKTSKDQIIALNDKAKEIIEYCPNLFLMKLTNQHVNRELKKIMRACNIKKKVSFHVSRHTFATTYLRMGGNVEKLQLLLGHEDIKQTMIYVHIVAAEANKTISLIDKLWE